jgi:hypothetical protein
VRSVILLALVWSAACGGAEPVASPPTTDTLEVHARAQDEEGLRRAAAALKGRVTRERMRALAALLEYEPVKLQPLFEPVSDRVAHGRVGARPRGQREHRDCGARSLRHR